LVISQIGLLDLLLLLTVIEHKNRSFTWQTKIIRIFAGNFIIFKRFAYLPFKEQICEKNLILTLIRGVKTHG